MRRSTGVLDDICNTKPVSPTAFSLSVPNAMSGTFSIACRDNAAVQALQALTSDGRPCRHRYQEPRQDTRDGERLSVHLPCRQVRHRSRAARQSGQAQQVTTAEKPGPQARLLNLVRAWSQRR
ncbi:beta-ketoacyl synthase chain length factor (plasmid) [Ralstonia solanacearum]|uniref:Beta-ketoacyl synthase-like N-terminal domain-containing protein n=1 Tax=Ralstonia solanacearum TaxID=305 RepID=A0A5H2Q926_RALSL|nr:hypothetical protein C2124_23085 [Ralstonia solanacearum]MBB6588397.1 beta-ketoacyl synthase chain length factor [Ralstonia solanacearum]QJC24011.1 beta-ketoacyl synthase chain length factor [Ralstonia solanacearum]